MKLIRTTSGKLINQILVFLLIFFIILTGKPLCATVNKGKSNIQKKCEKIMGSNPGSILVYDLKKRKFIAVVNKKIAFNSDYRPGSLFKLVTAASLLENNKIKPYHRELCNNHLLYMGKTYTCSIPKGHSYLNLIEAISYSCSMYFYKVSLQLTHQELKNTAMSLGCGRKFSPSKIVVSPGKCEPPQDPRKFLSFSIGDDEGITMTPWQVTNLVAMIASNRSLSPQLRRPAFKASTWKTLRDGMIESAKNGTCKSIKKSGIEAAAKTGTSTNFRNPEKYHGWFAGYYPAKKPRYVTVVFLEDGRGYSDAVPMGIKILNLLKTER
jgi:cell division protein FtsI/penicillin-binding protein 2